MFNIKTFLCLIKTNILGKNIAVPGSGTCTSTPKQATRILTSTPKAGSTTGATGPPTKRQRTNESEGENEGNFFHIM